MSDAARSNGNGRGLTALEEIHAEEELGKAYDLRLMRRLWTYVRRYRGQVLVTIALVAPLFALEVAPAWIVKTGIDLVMAGDASQGAATGALDRFLRGPGGTGGIGWLALLYAVAVVSSSGLHYVQLVLMARTGQSVAADLRRSAFAHIQRLHLSFFDRYPVGRLVTRASNDVENVAEMFSAGIVLLVTDVAKMAGFALVLALVDARLAAITFSVVPVLAGAAIVFRLRIREAFRKVRVRIARINTHVQETITGMKVVQLFTREDRNFADFEVTNAEHRDAWFQSIRYDAALFAVVEAAGAISIAIIIGFGSSTVEAGTLYLFIDLMRRFFLPLRDLSAKYSVMQSAMASTERIVQLLDTEPAIAEPEDPGVFAPDAAGAVEFEHVTFGYDGGDPVLRDVSFRVEPGERVAFVGATGAGKTTIIKLLTRFYDVDAGRITIDGVDVRDLPQHELRRRVAMVLQDVFVFSGSVAQNIGLHRTDVELDRIEAAARAVEADAFIRELPDGYDTELRERGTDLSTGQRQLLSFARALAHGADVLVLDEATSSIDTETEALVQRGIHTLMEGKTALVIAHRLSTIRDVDRIHVLHRVGSPSPGPTTSSWPATGCTPASTSSRSRPRPRRRGLRPWSGPEPAHPEPRGRRARAPGPIAVRVQAPRPGPGSRPPGPGAGPGRTARPARGCGDRGARRRGATTPGPRRDRDGGSP